MVLYPFLMYAITRHKEAKNAWCWVVAFGRRGERYVRRFYDQKLGGSRKALVAAVNWRDKELAKRRVLTMREFHQIKRSNNTSGVPGVHRRPPSDDQPKGGWDAYIRVADKVVKRTFSIRKYGVTGAFTRAVEARDRLLDLVDDKAFLRDKTARRMAR